MKQLFVLLLIILWLALLALAMVNSYLLFKSQAVDKQLLHVYTLKSAAPAAWKKGQDSLDTSIKALNGQKQTQRNSFPFRDRHRNLVLLGALFGVDALLSISFLWNHHKAGNRLT